MQIFGARANASELSVKFCRKSLEEADVCNYQVGEDVIHWNKGKPLAVRAG